MSAPQRSSARLAVVGIGEALRLSISRGHEAKTLAIVLLLFVTIIAIDQFSAWLRKKIVGDQAFAFGASV